MLEQIGLFERIQIYQRDRKCIFDSKEDRISAATVLQEMLFGKWSQVEQEMLRVGQEKLKILQKRIND